MRQVVLDTETTGIGPELGHRIIEIGCVELEDRKFTGRHYHVYLNPERAVDEGAFRVHGISDEFLADKPLFKSVLDEFRDFIEGAELIIHNAPFDLGFMDAEFKRSKAGIITKDICTVLDTLVMAREKHPGQRNSLDALCKRYDVDNANRTFHGALLDAEILAAVYLAMTGGQTSLFSDEMEQSTQTATIQVRSTENLSSSSPVIHASADELARHQSFVEFLVKKSKVNLWE